MARTTIMLDSILPRQEAFLVDAPTPSASPHRWIQGKTSNRGLCRACGLSQQRVWFRLKRRRGGLRAMPLQADRRLEVSGFW